MKKINKGIYTLHNKRCKREQIQDRCKILDQNTIIVKRITSYKISSKFYKSTIYIKQQISKNLERNTIFAHIQREKWHEKY